MHDINLLRCISNGLSDIFINIEELEMCIKNNAERLVKLREKTWKILEQVDNVIDNL